MVQLFLQKDKKVTSHEDLELFFFILLFILLLSSFFLGASKLKYS